VGLLFFSIFFFMKKLIIICSLAAAGLIILFFCLSRKEEKPLYTDLIPRKNLLAYTNEWTSTRNNATQLLNNIKKNPSDLKSLIGLTAIYIQEGRITGNLDYYNKAALGTVESVLAKDASNFEALTFKATILLSQHRFEEGLVIAKQAQKSFPLNAYVYGLLVDANVELGDYEAALEAAEKMVNIRPDIRSYARIAYLREIYGDIPGSIEAMELAIGAGAPGDENTEWCRVQLGKLYEKIGKMDFAKMQYTISAQNRENYPYALAGLAGLAAAEKKYPEALSLYLRADSLIPDHTFKEGIAEIYQLNGDTEKAKEMGKNILAYMQRYASGKKEGQNEDHELAHAYMGVGDYEKALEFALAECRRRPGNIEVNETAAIVYYEKGDFANALYYIEKALKTNCSNPGLLCHAGLIYAKNNKPGEAKKYLQKALANQPSLPADLEKECKDVLLVLKPL
jgi:tetratricopeptide (TPR) repeat protein